MKSFEFQTTKVLVILAAGMAGFFLATFWAAAMIKSGFGSVLVAKSGLALLLAGVVGVICLLMQRSLDEAALSSLKKIKVVRQIKDSELVSMN